MKKNHHRAMLKTIGFRQMLKNIQMKKRTLACIGLDPNPDKLPEPFQKWWWRILPTAIAVYFWMRDIVDATVPYASMFKPQSAYWEAIFGGRIAMWFLVRYIHRNYPEIPVFLDCKRGDIDRTQKKYAKAHLGLDNVDGMNFSPYMGSSCMKNLIDKMRYAGRAIVGLCYTSNPEARQIQDVMLADGRRFWEFIAKTTLEWAEEFGIVENAGLVMAAAYESPKGSGTVVSDFLRKCREIVGDKLWFLIPGVGKQGGLVRETVLAGWAGLGSMAISSSSGISEASSGPDYREAAAAEAKKLADESWAAAEEKMAA